MAKDTKQRIVKAALHCFNEAGYFNVRLQQIADGVGMSVGNMAYHYQHKSLLLKILIDRWKKEQLAIMADLHLTPIFENFDNFLQATFHLQEKYQFVYFDQMELIRNEDTIRQDFLAYYQNQQQQLEILLTLYQARGVLTKDQQIPFITLKMRRAIDHWKQLQWMEAQTEQSSEMFGQYVWAELLPYLTETGLTEHTETTAIRQQKYQRIETGK